MQRHFKWTHKFTGPKNGPNVWASDKLRVNPEVAHDRTLITCLITSHIHGPNTAFASVVISVEYGTTTHWGLDLNRLFKGPNSWVSARRWCNFILNNPPNSWRDWTTTLPKEQC